MAGLRQERAAGYSLPGRLLGSWVMVPALFIAGGLGGFALQSFPEVSQALLGAPGYGSSQVSTTRDFSVCAGQGRVTCVVDGDTFWLDGVKIRIADFNTPEVGQPKCQAEAALGARATVRLRELLSEGPFELVSVDRDQDRYGRKLRVVQRDGRSIADTMVAEGLAHHWQGQMETWC